MKAKYMIDTCENREFLRKQCEDLLNFAHRFPSADGSAYYLDEEGAPIPERDRETYVTARMAHSYSMGSVLNYPGSIELLDEALKGLCGSLRDKQNGGWYSALKSDGTPVNGKLCYAHAFVILAATSGILAERLGSKELLENALQVYDQYFWNEEEGLSCDAWNTEFTICDEYRGLNANMHTVEAFLAVADVAGLEKYRIRAGRIIDRVIIWAENNQWRIPEHFDKDWNADLECNREHPDDPFKPYGATPGHGLEWGRLITQWALSTYKEDRSKAEKYIRAAENLYRRAIRDAWNADGAPGIVYTTDWNGTPVVHDRMHWTLCEAINTAAVLYRVTGKTEYAFDYAEFMQYLDEKVIDHQYGSCFHQMDRNNQVIGTVWPGKNDIYHALQAMLIPYHAPEISIALAVRMRHGLF